MSIKNIVQLRDFLLNQLEKLSKGEIEIPEAVASAKLGDTALNSVKSELEYARMTNQEPAIAFLETDGKVINHKTGEIEAPRKRLSHDD